MADRRRTPPNAKLENWHTAIKMRHQGATFREIGDVLGVTPERVRQIYNRAIDLGLGWEDDDGT